jgi:hypothetical protein
MMKLRHLGNAALLEMHEQRLVAQANYESSGGTAHLYIRSGDRLIWRNP